MRIVFAALAALVIVAGATGCSRKETPPPPKPARVSATPAFERYFGPAPTTDKGTCYAFVIYFPLAKDPSKVTPFPFFTFDEGTRKKVALERMLGGMDEKVYAGQYLQPFPKGTRLASLDEKSGTVMVEFSREAVPAAADAARGAALYHAVALTLLQFPGVKAIRITSEGKDLYPPTRPLPVEEKVVQQPSAPRLLNVVAMKESSKQPVQEVDALFDRPVEIKLFQFKASDGTILAGDVFHSMFDMAAVLKPKDPGKFMPGTRVRVHYQVVDKLGRPAEGEGEFPLEVKQHQE